MATLIGQIPHMKTLSGSLFSAALDSYISLTSDEAIVVKRTREGGGYLLPSWLTFNRSTNVLSGIVPDDFSNQEVFQFQVDVINTAGNVTLTQIFCLVVWANVGQNLADLPNLPRTASECDYVLTSDNVATFDWESIPLRSTIGLSGDFANGFRLEGLNKMFSRDEIATKGGVGNEVLITNVDGAVVFTKGVSVYNSNYWRFISQAVGTDPYGIKFLNGDGGWVFHFKYNNYEGFEIANVYVKEWLTICFGIKNEMGLGNYAGTRHLGKGDNQSRISVHDCNVNDVSGEGFYFGTGFNQGRNYNNIDWDNHVTFTGDNNPSASIHNISGAVKLFDNYSGLWWYQVKDTVLNAENKYIGSEQFVAGGVVYDYCATQGYTEGVEFTYHPDSKLFPADLFKVRVHNNIVRNTGWDGIQVSNVKEDLEIYNNYIYNTGTGYEGIGNPIDIQLAHNEALFVNANCGKIYNNFIDTSTGTGLRIYMNSSTDVFNNIVMNCADGSFYGARAHNHEGLSEPGRPHTSRIFNNTFYNNTNYTFTLYTTVENILLQNNLWIDSGIESDITINNTTNGVAGTFVQSNNIFTTTSGANTIDPTNGDFRLQNGSLAIGAGMEISGYTSDFYQQVLNATKDAGAISFGSFKTPYNYNFKNVVPNTVTITVSDTSNTPISGAVVYSDNILHYPVIGITDNLGQVQLKTNLGATVSASKDLVTNTAVISANTMNLTLDIASDPVIVSSKRVHEITARNLTSTSYIHNWDTYPFILAVDNSGNIVNPTIVYTSRNEVSLNFESPFSGTIKLNGDISGEITTSNIIVSFQKININVGGITSASTWNNADVNGTFILNNTDNVNSNCSIQFSSFSQGGTSGTYPDTGTGLSLPDDVMQTYLFVGAGAVSKTATFTGQVGKKYTFKFFSSINASGTRITDFTINGETKSVESVDNTSMIVTFEEVPLNENNQIPISISVNAANSSAAYINAIIIEEY